jgi:hypothetical protein
MARNKLELVREILTGVVDEGERVARLENLPLAVRLYAAAQAIGAGRALGHLVEDDAAFSERLIGLWKYAMELKRQLNHQEWSDQE